MVLTHFSNSRQERKHWGCAVIKLRHCENSTKFEKISRLFLLSSIKTSKIFFSNFVAFSEKLDKKRPIEFWIIRSGNPNQYCSYLFQILIYLRKNVAVCLFDFEKKNPTKIHFSPNKFGSFHTSMHFSPINIRDVVSRWAGWALAHPEFGISVEPIPTMGGEGPAMPTRLLSAPPDLKT